MASETGNFFDSLLEIVRRVTLTYKNTAGEGSSIADISKIGLVAPITLVSSNLKSTKELYDIQQGLLNIYAAFYIQAVSILSTKIADARILKILDSVNPDRDLNTVTTALSIESHRDIYAKESDQDYVANVRKYLGLEGLDFGIKNPNLKRKISLEDALDDLVDEVGDIVEGERYEAKTSVGAVSTKKVDSFEKTEKTVGKVIEVSFQAGEKGTEKVTVPVVIRLDNMIVPGEVLSNILTMNEESIRLGSRFKDMLAGRISPIKDFLLCSDLIKKQKSTLMKDPSRAYASMLGRINSSKMYSILSRNVSLSTISGIMVISEVEENEVRGLIGGDLTNKKTRNMIFDNSSVMMIAVVDREWETVKIFVRDMDNYSEIPFSRFKESTTANTDALTEVFKSMSVGRVPTF